MRVLIDESLPVEIVGELPGFDTVTVHAQGWLHLRNGVLLRAAVRSGFSVLLTADSKLRYQQNVSQFAIGVVVIETFDTTLPNLRMLLPKIKSAIESAIHGTITVIRPT